MVVGSAVKGLGSFILVLDGLVDGAMGVVCSLRARAVSGDRGCPRTARPCTHLDAFVMGLLGGGEVLDGMVEVPLVFARLEVC